MVLPSSLSSSLIGTNSTTSATACQGVGATIRGVSLGALVKSRREATIDPLTGRPYTQEGLAKALRVTRSALKAIETGQTESIDGPKANRLADLLDVTIEELVQAMGFAIGTGPLSPEEAELVRLYRRLPEDVRPGLLSLSKSAAQTLSELRPPEGSRRRAG